MFAMEGEGVLIKSHMDDRHCFVKLLTVEVVGGHPVRVVEAADSSAEVLCFTGNSASSNSEDAATAGDVVERGKVFSEPQRMPLRHDVERHADTDLFGTFGEDRSDQDSVGDYLVTLELKMVLGEPVRVESESIAQHTRFDGLLGGSPDVFRGVAPISWGGWPTAGIIHLDTTKEKYSYSHVRSVDR